MIYLYNGNSNSGKTELIISLASIGIPKVLLQQAPTQNPTFKDCNGDMKNPWIFKRVPFSLGPSWDYFNIKAVLQNKGNPIIRIRWSYDYLIFMMGIAILVISYL